MGAIPTIKLVSTTAIDIRAKLRDLDGVRVGIYAAPR